MGMTKRLLKVAAVLSLAPLAGASCGDASRSQEAHAEAPSTPVDSIVRVYHFQTLKKVVLVDRGQDCATLSIGGVIAFIECIHSERSPRLVYSDGPRGLLLMSVRSGNTVSFPDGNVRVLAASEFWVAAQMSTDMLLGHLRFTVTTDLGTRYCNVDQHLAMFCQY
jgi:hypothetical protein